MMDLLRMRRSIRKYKDKDIDPRTIDDLKEAVLRAPSSRGINPWRFFFVTDRELLSRLSKAKEHGSDFIKGAPLGVVICADERESDVWVEDCSIASIILQLAGLSLGLGSCWIQIRNRSYSRDRSSEDYVREVLGLPQGLKVESMIAFGYPDEVLELVHRDQLEYGKILQR
jgi:nitroreductase